MPTAVMKEMVREGEAIDVSEFPREGNWYVIDNFQEDKDYCDLRTGQWVYSLGKRKGDGKVFASLKGEFYENPHYECLWLR